MGSIAKSDQDQAAAREHVAKLAEDRKRDGLIYDLLSKCGIPKRYQSASFTDVGWLKRLPAEVQTDYHHASQDVRSLLLRPCMIALLGRRGVGKTYMACCLVREFCENLKPAIYAEAMDYFVALQDTYGDKAKETQSQVERRFLLPHLLVLDGMEERADTPWNDRMLNRLINKRYAAGVSTLFISNEEEPEFKTRVGESIIDRIKDDGIKVVCKWQSLRGRIIEVPPDETLAV